MLASLAWRTSSSVGCGLPANQIPTLTSASISLRYAGWPAEVSRARIASAWARVLNAPTCTVKRPSTLSGAAGLTVSAGRGLAVSFALASCSFAFASGLAPGRGGVDVDGDVNGAVSSR